MNETVAAIRSAESGGNDNARNTRSSAAGRYQFTDDTWLVTYAKEYGRTGETREQILSKKFNPTYQERLMGRLTRDNQTFLQRRGQKVTKETTYLAHFAGADGAARLLSAPEGTPASRVLGKKAIAANPHLRGMTAQDVVRWAAGHVNGRPTRKPNAKYSDDVGGGASATTVELKDVPIDDLLYSRPDALFADGRRPLRPTPREQLPSKRDSVFQMLTGGKGLQMAPDVNDTISSDTAQREAASVQKQRDYDRSSVLDIAKAVVDETQVVPAIIRALDDGDTEYDPAFTKRYAQNWKQIESIAKDDQEVEMLREAVNEDDLYRITHRIFERRANNDLIDQTGHGTALRVMSGIFDPAGWIAGLGAGKVAQLGRVGSFALAQEGHIGSAVLSSSLEGLAGNIALDAGLDASGEYVSPEQYSLSAIGGLTLGGLVAPLHIRAGQDAAVTQQVTTMLEQEEAALRGAREAAVTKLGPNATEAEIAEEARSAFVRQAEEDARFSLADIPEHHKLLIGGETLTDNPAVKQQQVDGNDLGSISDAVERNMVAEVTARSENILANNPINQKGLGTILERIGQESVALRLLKSESSVAKAVGLTLIENPSGAGGRRRTAAIVQNVRERRYMQELSGYDALIHQWRRQEGIGRVRDFISGDARNEFNRRVFMEVEARMNTPTGHQFDSSPIVNRAADIFERGMELMRVDQQNVMVVGAARLGENSRGYVPHRLDPRKVLALSPQQQKKVRSILSSQFQTIEGFDKKFSNKLAAKYLERAQDGAHGRYHVPFNLYSPEAGEMVRDALKAIGVEGDDLDKLMGKFSRGGAGHTKKRLRLDLSESIGDDMVLGDLFVTDMQTLYRSYARRVSGEVALAQFGVMGKKGLQLLSKAISETGGTAADIRAFDQMAAEFLNTPFGDAQHVWMDNMRALTSASRLGGMGFTQLAEFGNALPVVGVQRTLTAIKDIPEIVGFVRAVARGEKKEHPILQSVDQLNGHLGLEDYHMTRMFDVRDNSIELYNGESLDIATRAIRGTSNAMMVLSGHRMIMAAQTRGMAEQVVRKAVQFAKSGKNDEALKDIGFTDELLGALRKDLGNVARFDGDDLLELDLFKAQNLTKPQIAQIINNVERASAQIIQRTFIGETGAWAHSSFLKWIFQFRTFSITAVEKQWGRNAANYGALRSFMYLMGAMAFALPIHLARVTARMAGMGEAEREKYADRNLSLTALGRATMNYASSAGLSGDILDLGVGFAAEWGGDWGEVAADSMNVRGKRNDRLIGGVVAPSAELVQDIWAAAHGDENRLIRAIPGNNLPYVTPFLNALGD